MLVGALAAGDAAALAGATEDRLHQDGRLSLVPHSRETLELLAPRSLAVWLSGSGPTIAAFVERAAVAGIDAELPPGRLLELEIDGTGVRVEEHATA
jgi:homoserine kinase